MLHTIKVDIDANGQIHPVDSSESIPPGRALVVVLGQEFDEAAVLAEHALAEEWLSPEEDEAWANLQPRK